MPVLPATEDEIEGLSKPGTQQGEVVTGFVAPATEAELKGIIPFVKQEPTIKQKIVGRFMGSDVDDPLEFTRASGTVVGGFTGGMLGSRVPRMPGPVGLVINPVTGSVAFGLIGTIVGAASPELAMEAGEAIGFLPSGTRAKTGLTNEELRTVLEGEALLELATLGGLSALRLTGRTFTQLIAGVGRAEKELARQSAQHGIALLPIQVGERTLARGYVAVMGRFPLFAGPIRRHGFAAERAAQEAFEGAIDRIGPIRGWNEISEAIYKDANKLLANVNRMFSKAYDDIWRQADILEVKAVPKATVDKANEIVDKVTSDALRVFDDEGNLVAGEVGPVLEKVRDFITRKVLPMAGETEQGGRILVKQDYRQMDALLTQIDQELATFEPGQKRFAFALLNQLRQSVQLDMLQNVTAPNVSDALHIAQRLRATDQNFSFVMSELFETSAATRFASVKKRGLRAVGAEKATRTPVDQLANVVVKMDSPQMVDELARIVSPETMEQITAKTIRRAFVKAFDNKQLNLEYFSRQLGLKDIDSARAQALQRMLRHSNSDLTVEHLQELLAAGRAIAGSEIPDISAFIARRLTIGGLQSGIGALLVSFSLAGGAAKWGGQTLFQALAVLGGGRMISTALADPKNSRFIIDVLDKEATQLVRRNATLKILRAGIAKMRENDDITETEAANMIKATKVYMLEMKKIIEGQQGNEK